MINVLIFGNCGYIGSLLTRRLCTEFGSEIKVTGVDNLIFKNSRQVLSSLATLPNFHFFKSDITKWETELDNLIGEADVIYPLASLVGAPLADKYPDKSREVNEVFIKRLTESLSSGQRVVYPNTNSSYGACETQEKLTEESPLNPLSYYGKHKLNAEKIVLDNHYNSVVLRLGTVYGLSPRPRYDLLIHTLCTELLFKKKVKLFEVGFKRNFVHIYDVVSAFIQFGFNRRNLGLFNFNMPTVETKLSLAQKIGRQIEAMYGFQPEIEIGEGYDMDQRNYDISCDKLLLETDFQFMYERVGELGDLYEILKFTEAVGYNFTQECNNLNLV